MMNQCMNTLCYLSAKKHFEFPSPEQLCDYYRLIYLEQEKQVSDQALAGAAAFKVHDEHDDKSHG